MSFEKIKTSLKNSREWKAEPATLNFIDPATLAKSGHHHFEVRYRTDNIGRG